MSATQLALALVMDRGLSTQSIQHSHPKCTSSSNPWYSSSKEVCKFQLVVLALALALEGCHIRSIRHNHPKYTFSSNPLYSSSKALYKFQLAALALALALAWE
jgi:hypothetical protein